MRSIILLAALALGFSSCNLGGQGADLVLTNAKVYTLSWDEPDTDGVPAADSPYADGRWTADAEAIAIRDGLIVAVGNAGDVEPFIGRATRVIDLQGATVVPGLVESHGHLHELGEKHEQIDLIGVESEEDIAARLVGASTGRGEGEWIVGSGWDEGEWADHLPTRDFLNRLFPDNPVVLKGLRGFGTLGNDLALRAAGVTNDFENPVGGELVHDDTGEFTGVFLNNATDILNDAIPEGTLEQKKRILLYGFDQLMRQGFVTTHHAGVRTDYLPVYQALAESSVPMRVEAMLSVGVIGAPSVEKWTAIGPTEDPAAMLQIRSVKAYYDASLGSRGARMLEDYSDMPGHRGVSGTDYGFDVERVRAFMAAGFQAGIHAIGDAGNREVLDFYATTFDKYPHARALRNRIEHAQVIHPDDIARFADLNVVASMEPGHAVEDSPWAEARIGPDRIKGAYAWRTLRRNGAKLIFNSDFTGTDWSFFYGMYAAVTRRMKDGTPQGGWYPAQVLTPEEALRAYTVWPAWASSREDLTGTIEVGKWADLTVMDIDPLRVGLTNPDDLLDGMIEMTIVGGEIVYERTPIQ